jgi:hypothetical protein
MADTPFSLRGKVPADAVDARCPAVMLRGVTRIDRARRRKKELPTSVLECPHCGGTNVHPTSIRCNPAGSLPGEVIIEAGGILWNPDVDPDGRGVRIEIVFWCENDHPFGAVLHFHKGTTFTTWTCEPDDPPRETIWRD